MFPEDEGKRENDFLFPSLVICLRLGIDIQPLCDMPNEGKAGWSLGIAVFRGGLPDKLPLCGRPIHSCHLPISVLT